MNEQGDLMWVRAAGPFAEEAMLPGPVETSGSEDSARVASPRVGQTGRVGVNELGDAVWVRSGGPYAGMLEGRSGAQWLQWDNRMAALESDHFTLLRREEEDEPERSSDLDAAVAEFEVFNRVEMSERQEYLRSRADADYDRPGPGLQMPGLRARTGEMDRLPRGSPAGVRRPALPTAANPPGMRTSPPFEAGKLCKGNNCWRWARRIPQLSGQVFSWLKHRVPLRLSDSTGFDKRNDY